MAHRSVLITGSSTGIGAACAARLARAGWQVYAGVRRPEDGDRLAARHAGAIEPVIVDVCDQASIDAVIDHIAAADTGLDALVNNAGVSSGGAVEALDIDAWRAAFETNFFGLIAMTKAAFPLIDAAGGRFVHIGSIAGRVAAPGLAPYAATKHAVSALNWSLRAELAHLGPMTSSVVEPGEVRTAIWAKAEQQLTDRQQELDRAGLTERYWWLLDLIRGFLDEAEEKAIEPDLVAKVVERALTAKRPKARYLVGNDAKVQAALARLPDRAREFGLTKAYGIYIQNGRKRRVGAA
ncbi:MAG: SDR family NAD(P)-dependent oxidoreductase [Ilumatobacter sp.]|uniref:SDR family NAD(P)-dependent oxidoreductase n=1 Tax=Ilumatobacter sp. TaxID=1967498 RepID=UPI00261EB296|nr:SDR family NAD(P)-dependent oxidoreductase [Ilumatobacter sp.]MDJ0771188.1 SDR family NAD(P)-dependent oxidoreductase [Ilumatobacter sp.]